MTLSARSPRVAIALTALWVGSHAVAAEKAGIEKAGVEAKVAFDRLKSLAGDWKIAEPEGGSAGDCHVGKIAYKVTGRGSSLMETFAPGTENEMVSVYHLDGDELRMTHYCAAGNQPRFKLDRKASTADHLVFAFDGGSNLDPAKDMHVHSGEVNFLGAGKVESSWDAFADGKKAMTSKFTMTRP